MGNDVAIDFFIYKNDLSLFRRSLEQHQEGHSHYFIIPQFLEGEEQATEAINQITGGQLILLDKCFPGITIPFKAVYEPFENDIFNTLKEALPRLANYQRLHLVFPAYSYYPREILYGFKNFCTEHAFPFRIIDQLYQATIEKGNVFIYLMEDHLIVLLEKAKERQFQVGADVGIISYNKTT